MPNETIPEESPYDVTFIPDYHPGEGAGDVSFGVDDNDPNLVGDFAGEKELERYIGQRFTAALDYLLAHPDLFYTRRKAGTPNPTSQNWFATQFVIPALSGSVPIIGADPLRKRMVVYLEALSPAVFLSGSPITTNPSGQTGMPVMRLAQSGTVLEFLHPGPLYAFNADGANAATFFVWREFYS